MKVVVSENSTAFVDVPPKNAFFSPMDVTVFGISMDVMDVWGSKLTSATFMQHLINMAPNTYMSR
jgi:hypothetical protein